MSIKTNMERLSEIADDDKECYCPDGSDEYWRCRTCFASEVLNEISSIAYDGMQELLKENSDIVK